MAINFMLKDKVTNKPVSPIDVDEIICKEILNVEAHPKYYGGDCTKSDNTFNWFDSIGFQLASGKELEDGDNSVRRYYQESDMWQEELPIIEKIIDFLQSRYVCDSWVSFM
jgi:hypothetical protein